MNHIKSLLFILALSCSAISFFSCKSESGSQTKNFYIHNADSILSHHNANLPAWEQAVITEGSVEIIVKEERITVVHLDDHGMETMHYFLQTEKKKHKMRSERINRAEVIYLGRGLIVNALDIKQTLYFHLESDPIPKDVKEIGGVQSFKGYGLGVRKIIHGTTGDNAPYCACDHASTPPGNCKAGQKMELNCVSANDFGSCKVVCTGQTYACCDRGFE